MDCHDIRLIKSLGAIRAFPHAISKASIDAVIAKSMAASLDCRIFEIFSTDRAQSESLNK